MSQGNEDDHSSEGPRCIKQTPARARRDTERQQQEPRHRGGRRRRWYRRIRGRQAGGRPSGRRRARAGGSRRYDARPQHTAHHSSLSQVHYRHHPLFGQDVRVVRALHQRGTPSVIIELPDGAQIAVPKWMLDPLRCRSMREEGTPIIAIGALVELSALVRRPLLTPPPSLERPHIVDLQGGPDDAARGPTAPAGAPATVDIHSRGPAPGSDAS